MYFCIDKIWYFQKEDHNIRKRNPKRPPRERLTQPKGRLVNLPSDIGHVAACSISNDLWLALVWTIFNPHWLGICWKQNVQTKLWPFWAFQLKETQCLCSCLRSTYLVRNNSGFYSFYSLPSALTPTNSRGHHPHTLYHGCHPPGYG